MLLPCCCVSVEAMPWGCGLGPGGILCLWGSSSSSRKDHLLPSSASRIRQEPTRLQRKHLLQPHSHGTAWHTAHCLSRPIRSTFHVCPRCDKSVSLFADEETEAQRGQAAASLWQSCAQLELKAWPLGRPLSLQVLPAHSPAWPPEPSSPGSDRPCLHTHSSSCLNGQASTECWGASRVLGKGQSAPEYPRQGGALRLVFKPSL